MENCKICGDDWKRKGSGPLRPINGSNIRSFNEQAFKHGIGSKDDHKPRNRPDMICGLCESMFITYHD